MFMFSRLIRSSFWLELGWFSTEPAQVDVPLSFLIWKRFKNLSTFHTLLPLQLSHGTCQCSWGPLVYNHCEPLIRRLEVVSLPSTSNSEVEPVFLPVSCLFYYYYYFGGATSMWSLLTSKMNFILRRQFETGRILPPSLQLVDFSQECLCKYACGKLVVLFFRKKIRS